MKNIIPLISCVLITFFCSCTSDNEEDLFGTTTCDTSNTSYAQDLVPIIERSCFNCHDSDNNNGNVTLEGYTNVKRFVDNNRLIGAIKHLPGFAPMPQGKAMLVECEIEKFEEWIQNGAPNN